MASAAAPLLEVLAHEREPLTYAAAESLGKLGDPRAVPALLTAAGSPDSALRMTAVASLERFDGDEVTRALTRATSDAKWFVRLRARRALSRRR